jgi:acetylglutamate kinase
MIADLLKRLNIETSFVKGMRVTDKATVEVAEMVLSGLLNKRTVHEIGIAGGRAVGLSGKDNSLMRCVPLDPELGLVGDPVTINTAMLNDLLRTGLIPVIAPIGQGFDGDANTYNVNADVAASVVAKELKATRLLLLTDVAGVLDKGKSLIPNLTATEIGI